VNTIVPGAGAGEREPEAVKAFRTHANYLRAFSQLAGFDDPGGRDTDALANLLTSVTQAAEPRSRLAVAESTATASLACLSRGWGPS
jgi:hypothetical protein